jgi:hypothetical protein
MKTADVDVPGVVTLGWCTLLISYIVVYIIPILGSKHPKR